MSGEKVDTAAPQAVEGPLSRRNTDNTAARLSPVFIAHCKLQLALYGEAPNPTARSYGAIGEKVTRDTDLPATTTACQIPTVFRSQNSIQPLSNARNITNASTYARIRRLCEPCPVSLGHPAQVMHARESSEVVCKGKELPLTKAKPLGGKSALESFKRRASQRTSEASRAIILDKIRNKGNKTRSSLAMVVNREELDDGDTLCQPIALQSPASIPRQTEKYESSLSRMVRKMNIADCEARGDRIEMFLADGLNRWTRYTPVRIKAIVHDKAPENWPQQRRNLGWHYTWMYVMQEAKFRRDAQIREDSRSKKQ